MSAAIALTMGEGKVEARPGTGTTVRSLAREAGADTQLACAVLVESGEVLHSLVARRTRQYPADFGRASTFVETIEGLVSRNLLAVGSRPPASPG